jgi:hypothetical protein
MTESEERDASDGEKICLAYCDGDTSVYCDKATLVEDVLRALFLYCEREEVSFTDCLEETYRHLHGNRG